MSDGKREIKLDMSDEDIDAAQEKVARAMSGHPALDPVRLEHWKWWVVMPNLGKLFDKPTLPIVNDPILSGRTGDDDE